MLRPLERATRTTAHSFAGSLRLQQTPRGIVTRFDDRSMPLVIDGDETLGERRELRASVLGAASRDLEDGCAQDALHVTDSVDARAIAHVALRTCATNRPRHAYRLEQPDVARPDEELAVTGEPSLEPCLHAAVEESGARAGCRRAIALRSARRRSPSRSCFSYDRVRHALKVHLTRAEWKRAEHSTSKR